MKHSIPRLCATLLASLTCATLAASKPPLATTPKKLDISEYLNLANGEEIYPTAGQIEMLKAVMPATAYRPAPPISDRAYWTAIAKKESAQKIIETATADLETKPEVPITDEIYRRANKEGNRGIYKPRYYRTMERLEKATVAECMENEGRFMPTILEHIHAILEMKSWLHPNHDPGNQVLEGKRVNIDLGARKFGSVIMLAEVLLEDKLPADLRKEMKNQIQWRMIDSYLASCRGEDKKGNSWIRGTSNWNSVCTGGTVFSSITASDNPEERLLVIGCALNSMKSYLFGFGDDGYCSEGIGYWNYGFGNYLYLAQMVYDYTDGAIDMFAFDIPEKMVRVANFPEQFEIQNKIYPCFADGGAIFDANSDNFAYIQSAKHYGARKPTYSRPADITQQIMEWNDKVSYVDANREDGDLPPYTYFEDYGILISRGQQTVPFSIAMKAGHNAENHNHSDVGSFVMVFDSDFIMSGELGSPPYEAGSFSPTHKARCSWGHPVPFVNKTMQSNGRKFRGEVLDTAFTENSDKIVIDLKAAYEVPALETLIRTLENEKSGNGTVTITDTFTSSDPIEFGTAILTQVDYKIVQPDTVVLKYEGKTIKAKISAEGGSFKIKDEEVIVKRLRYADEAFRIGIDFKKEQTNGSITIVYTPVP